MRNCAPFVGSIQAKAEIQRQWQRDVAGNIAKAETRWSRIASARVSEL